jgi:hypothetical protein
MKKKVTKKEKNELPKNSEVTPETKPAETKPAETKPAETKPVETKPAETKPIKRKRGRPKKIRTPEEQEKQKKPKKKRGRKPRQKTKEELENSAIKRKRGRKPRDRFYTLSSEQKKEMLETKLHQDSMIVFLPINLKKLEKSEQDPSINNKFIENSILSYEPTLNIPQPYDPSVNNQDFNSHSELSNQILSSEKSINDDKKMNKLMDTYKEVEYQLEEREHLVTTRIRNTMNEFMTSNKNNTWVNQTNIRCWWCCYEFDNTPVGIPISYQDNCFNVYGCFCSFNCSLSYNFNDDGNKKWERVGLIHLLYKKTHDTKEANIGYAPKREFLKIFGGNMDINEFRENNNNKKYEVVYPPMLSIIPQLEETEIFAESNKLREINKEIPVDDDRIERARDKLKLKRSKPLREKNTLEHCMNLKRLRND